MLLYAFTKLVQRWLSPFVIIGRIRPLAYQLDLLEGLCIHPIFYISSLREYRDLRDGCEPRVLDPIVSDGSLEWEVERILHHWCIGHGK